MGRYKIYSKEVARQRIRDSQIVYYQLNKVAIKHKIKISRGEIRIELLEFLSGWPPKCQSCGYKKDVRILQFDHINGHGTKRKNGQKNRNDEMRYYCNHPLKAKKHLQVLCPNCNWIKRFDNREDSNIEYIT